MRVVYGDIYTVDSARVNCVLPEVHRKVWTTKRVRLTRRSVPRWRNDILLRARSAGRFVRSDPVVSDVIVLSLQAACESIQKQYRIHTYQSVSGQTVEAAIYKYLQLYTTPILIRFFRFFSTHIFALPLFSDPFRSSNDRRYKIRSVWKRAKTAHVLRYNKQFFFYITGQHNNCTNAIKSTSLLTITQR